jgi:transposase
MSDSRYTNSRSYCKALVLNLKERSSGQHQGQLKLTKRGPRQARWDLYLATLRLIHCDAIARGWYERKVQAQGGRHKKKVIVAWIAQTGAGPVAYRPRRGL